MKNTKIISSKKNLQVKNISQLIKSSKHRKKQGQYVVEGIKMVEEAVDEGLVFKVYASESFYKKREDTNFFDHLDYEVLTDSIFNSISDTMTPQGLMGIVKKNEYEIEQILTKDNAFLLILEDIRDPGNLGTMIRAAEGAGVTGIIMNNFCVDLYNPKTIRSSMGSIFRMPVCIAKDFHYILEKVKKSGITLYGAHLKGKSYFDEKFNKKTAFIIGNEANGLSKESSTMADRWIKIPMEGKVESLNAAIAATILMYEKARQSR